MNSKELKRLRRKLPQWESGTLAVDLFTEVFFDDGGAWLVDPDGVFRSFRSSEGWCPWEKRDFSRISFKEWLLKRRGGQLQQGG